MKRADIYCELYRLKIKNSRTRKPGLKERLRYVEIKLAKSHEQVESMERKVTSEREEIKVIGE